MNTQLLTALVFVAFFLSVAFIACVAMTRSAMNDAAEKERERVAWRERYMQASTESGERFQMYLKEAAQNVFLTAEISRLKSQAASDRAAESGSAACPLPPEAETCARSGKRRAKTPRGR